MNKNKLTCKKLIIGQEFFNLIIDIMIIFKKRNKTNINIYIERL